MACINSAFAVKLGAVNEGKKQKSKRGPQSLEEAIGNLVKGLKHDLLKKYGRVNYARLRKDGYSDYLLSRLKRASE